MTEQMDGQRGATRVGDAYDPNVEQWRLAAYIARRVCDRASGRMHDECLRNYPHDTYFIGNLRHQDDEHDPHTTKDAFDEMHTKLAPVAFGTDIRLRASSNKVEIAATVEWSVYYRIFPTLAQQREQQGDSPDSEFAAPTTTATDGVGGRPDTVGVAVNAADDEDERTILQEQEREERQAEVDSPDVVQSTRDRWSERRAQDDSLFVRFRKVECRGQGRVVLHRTGTDEWRADARELQQALDSETDRVRRQALSDPERLFAKSSSYENVKVPARELENQITYESFLKTLRNPVEPDWRWHVGAEVWRGGGDEVSVSIELVNASPGQEPPGNVSASVRRKKANPNIEPFLFDTRASFAMEGGELLPFEIDLAPRGFRYDNRMWGKGFNCAVRHVEGKPDVLETTHTPFHEQRRYSTQTLPAARFDDLAKEDPIPVLDAILEAMESYLDRWDEVRHDHVDSDASWEATHGADFDMDRHAFELEIARFRRGRDLIRDDEDIRKAFRLTNETFRRAGEDPRPEKRKESWRLFQIVFLVSQMPGMAALADPGSQDVSELDQVDIVYFPTGGGKTEAYLAAMVFHCFFDRLRGKAAGVTAWIRFPLRLLTLQQTQRVADVMAMAELARREDKDDVRLTGSNVAGFGVGYFVGSEATPNELLDPDRAYSPKGKDRANWSTANDPGARQRWRRLIYCPACRRKSVEVAFDARRVRLIHRCKNESCVFSKFIPVYVVDNEVYRYLPSIIVGTIDKLAGMGNQRKMSLIFGNVDGKCEKHGYYKDKCCQKDCWKDSPLDTSVPKGLSGPTLFVQDELHLLKEGLGTFDGHYETFVQEMRRQRGENAPLKIIASSATIEKFERQVEHLYGREQGQARVFPGLGPKLEESFYAHTRDYPQRIFVGIIPHNKTIFNATLELIESFHRETQSLRRLGAEEANPYGGQLQPGTESWQQLVDFYLTSLTYFSVGRILNSIRTDLGSDVNRNLERDGFGALAISELTGSTTTDEVTGILEHLEQPTSDDAAESDAVLATSMVSHGVDIDRLNAMIFYGMPRQTAEYIQASSRVGRANVGLVFSCLHPIRERDQSHYGYFVKYHEYMGQLVEPVAINRWAKYSIHRTLPGLFMGVLLQLLAHKDVGNASKYYKKDFVQKKINKGEITAEDFVPVLEKAYRVDDDDIVGATVFRKEIRKKVGRFLDQIQSLGYEGNFVSDSLRPYKPMMSLRDVDEPVEIELDWRGSQWAEESSGS
jgi:hypothetical protein